VLVVGAASRDVTTADPRGWQLGGAATYATLSLARFGVPVRALIGVDPAAAAADELDLLREAGAEVALAELEHGPVFENVEAPEGRTQLCLSTSDPMPVAALPRGWGEEAQAVLLVPVAGELSDAWAGVPTATAFVALGWQGLLRILEVGAVVQRRAPGPGPMIERADLVVVSEDDLVLDARGNDLAAWLRPAATLVVTDGEAGGRVASPLPGARGRLWRRYPAIPSDAVVDPTGAGDVFLAAMVAARIHPSVGGRQPGRASDIRLAAAAASLATEAPGLLGVPELPEVLRRMRRRATRRPAA
jgi:hypothetical protein